MPEAKEGHENFGQEIVSHDGEGKKYVGGEVAAEGIKPDDFDSENPLTTDDQGRLIRGAKLVESKE